MYGIRIQKETFNEILNQSRLQKKSREKATGNHDRTTKRAKKKAKGGGCVGDARVFEGEGGNSKRKEQCKKDRNPSRQPVRPFLIKSEASS